MLYAQCGFCVLCDLCSMYFMCYVLYVIMCYLFSCVFYWETLAQWMPWLNQQVDNKQKAWIYKTAKGNCKSSQVKKFEAILTCKRNWKSLQGKKYILTFKVSWGWRNRKKVSAFTNSYLKTSKLYSYRIYIKNQLLHI